MRSILERLAAHPALVRNALTGVASIALVFGITVSDPALDAAADVLSILIPVALGAMHAKRSKPAQ